LKPQHPVEYLSVRSGKLMYQHAASDRAEEYLNTPQIEVTGKEGHRELGSTEVAYTFTLNAAPDPTWSQFFAAYLGDPKAKIVGAKLVIHCIPANLETRYQKAKEAVAKANQVYVGHKASLIEEIKQLDTQREQAGNARNARSEAITTQFGNLPL
jgi:hypothetical protein